VGSAGKDGPEIAFATPLGVLYLEVEARTKKFGTGMKLGYIVAVRLVETVLGNVFVWSGGAFYRYYEHPVQRWGISAHADQGIAGGLMMIEGSLVTLGALAWLFLRLGRESELHQQLLEQGVDPRAATRAVRYGRGSELSVGEPMVPPRARSFDDVEELSGPR